MPTSKLLDPVREHIRGKHLSRRTEQAHAVRICPARGKSYRAEPLK